MRSFKTYPKSFDKYREAVTKANEEGWGCLSQEEANLLGERALFLYNYNLLVKEVSRIERERENRRAR